MIARTQPVHLPRARDRGIVIGRLAPGPHNGITDVPGVLVGHRTLAEDRARNTGVTAILPHAGNIFRLRPRAACSVGNGHGKFAGSTQIDELGEIETPILLTNTLAVGTALQALVRHTIGHPANPGCISVNGVVGETNDCHLNDIRALPVTVEDCLAAIADARSGPVAQGSVGAGAGTVSFGWKGGIGTASRRIGGWTLGVLVQSNFGGFLRLPGVPAERLQVPKASADGSIVMVVATDAPVGERNLRRLAARTMTGLARTGSTMSNGSGDYGLAFSTAALRELGSPCYAAFEEIPNQSMDGLFEAVIDATEEAIYDSMLLAAPVAGFHGRVESLGEHLVRMAG